MPSKSNSINSSSISTPSTPTSTSPNSNKQQEESIELEKTSSSSIKETKNLPIRTSKESEELESEEEEEEVTDYEIEMSLANSLLNGGTGSGSSSPFNSRRSGGNDLRTGNGNNHPFKSLTPKRIVIILLGMLMVIFYFGKGSGYRSSRDNMDLASGGTKTNGKIDEYIKLPVGDGKSSHKGAVKIEEEQAPDIPPVIIKVPDASPQKQKGINGKCIPPYGKKPISYALMIDAGSTGSRLHLYTFSHCDPTVGALPKLEDEGFFMTKPGLSAFSGKPREAAESLRVLMDEAMQGVPKEERACTPIAVKATAGLRMLGTKESDEILNEVERWLKSDWPFSLINKGVVIMDGGDEGVFAWITINFLLGLIGPDNVDPNTSAAVMDLGGASTQIVFEPSFLPTSPVKKLASGDHVYDLTFAGTEHALYQHSHLGYGLMQARRAVHNLIAFSHVWSNVHKKGKEIIWESLTKEDKIHHPCLFKDESKIIELDPPGRKKVEVTFVGTGAGFEACRRVVEVMLAKDAVCEVEPCAFGGVYQPKLGEVFGAGKVWALSYFYDRIAPLGLTSPFPLSALKTLTSNVCAGRKSPTWSRFKGNEEALNELSDRPEYCLDLTFMYSLLSLGYELDEEREIYIGKQVGKVELGWALGAALNMETGHLTCRTD